MPFNASHVIAELERNQSVINHLLNNTGDDEIKYRPDNDKWCLLEVICHLRDEEVEDFRARVQSVLNDPDQALSPIDPVGWVTSRQYLENDFHEVLRDWNNERGKSIQWLRSLNAPSWENAFLHPKFGPMSAQLFLCNWLSHDYHHIRQINAIKRAYLMNESGENLRYAGVW